MADFYKLHFNAGEILAETPDRTPSMTVPDEIRKIVRTQIEVSSGFESVPDRDIESPIARSLGEGTREHAARYYTEELLKSQGSELLAELTSPESPMLVPNLLLNKSEFSPLTNSNVVIFTQTSDSIPVFGGKATVELDNDSNRLLAFDANLAPAPRAVSAVASLSPVEAIGRLESYCGTALPSDIPVTAPVLTYFQEEVTGVWHLAYHFKAVPLTPPQEDAGELPEEFQHADLHSCCDDSSPRVSSPEYDYLVDAHTGEVVFWFSSAPRVNIPVPCSGIDEDLLPRSFYGLNSGTAFLLHDPTRNISTYDLGFGMLNPNQPPPDPISSPQADFPPPSNTAAVSAHWNATVVFDFFNNVLKRKGIDDAGMLLKSVVNVVNSSGSKEWRNASWWKGHMWYGQISNGNGGYVSYSKHLDVIGHELAHGVTEKTAGLIYAHLPGALNESFSDIFGILIKNWSPVTGFRPLVGWNWQMGPGLSRSGGPLRDFSNPAVTGHPDHFRHYVPLPNTEAGDWGGVHYYSGIHNLAVYNVITTADPAGAPLFSPDEVATLYYLTLRKLSARSNFSDCRRTLLNVAGFYYSYSAPVLQDRLQAIAAAYDLVGIS